MIDRAVARAAKKVTITEVARVAGVSVGTVSLALSGSSRCALSTSKRVRAVAAELDYVPNHLASSLRRRSTESITLVVPDVGNPVYVAMAKAVQRVAKERGYHLLLVSTDGLPDEEIHAVRGLARRQVDGLIICSLRAQPALIRALEASDAPVCVVGRLPGTVPVDNVGVDSEAGAALVVEHLALGGRRAIAFVNGSAGTVPAEARLRGYRRGLERQGLTPDPLLEATADFTMAGGRAALDALLERRPALDAVFCANDLMAIGAMKRLQERGIHVPGEVAVVGMDDISECLYCTPTLSSVSLSAGERGRLAAEMLLDRLAAPGEPAPPRRATVSARLAARESSGRPVARGGTA